MFRLFILIMQAALQFMLYIMINQYQLMSHITAQQGKFGRFELGTTSKYICNYIQQRKALMLSKLARNSSTSDSNIDQIPDLPKNVNIKQLDRRYMKQESKGHMRKKTSEVSCVQKSNKINKNDRNHRQNDSNKFLVRSSLYQKQKNLNFQVQKKKVLFSEAQSHSFHPNQPKTDESMQLRVTQKKSQKVEQTYMQRHERKHSRNLSQQRVNYKDLTKLSMTKFDKDQQKPSAIRQEKNRWRAIQEMFEKVQFQQPLHNQTIKIDEQQACKMIREKDSMQEQIHCLEVNQFMISLKKIHSEEQSVKKLDQNMEIQQHFEQDLSGILIDEDLREEVDSSHVFQQVMNDMMPQIEPMKPEYILQKQVAEAEVVQTISVLEQSSSQKAQYEVNINSYHQFKHIAEQQWITNEEKENNSQQLILIKKVESQIIKNCDVQYDKDQPQQILAQSKVQKLRQHPSIQIQNSVHNQSLIDKLSEQLIEEVPLKQVIIDQQQQINERQRQSLQALANQFMFLKNDKKSFEDDQDLDIPDEQCPTVSLQCFNFNIISHEFTKNTVVRSIHLPEPIAPIQNYQFVSLNELNQIQSEQTIQQIYQAQQFQYQELKMNVLISSLKNFGEFLVIPEESEQESRQSVQ